MEQRILASFLTIIIFLKCLYYLKMIDSLAPHISIIFEIFFAIRYFIFIFGLTVFAFTMSFYLLGRNQIQFDSITPTEAPVYSEFGGALWQMWMLCLGGPEVDGFFIGENKLMKPFLLIMFFLSALSILIHLLNMLIAIMGDTFSKNNEVEHEKKLKEQLTFIIDLWFFKDYCLGNAEEIKYVVAAFLMDEDLEENHLNVMSEQIQGLHKEINDMRGNLFAEIQEMKFHNDIQEKETQMLYEQNALMYQAIKKLVRQNEGQDK